MKKLLDSIIAELEANRPLVISGVIASSGSTPRGAGAMMAVFNSGDSAGTIGGGAVEYEAQKQAAHMFDAKQPYTASYTLAKNDVADLGMICGGDVTIYYEYIDPASPRWLELFKHMRGAFNKNNNSWLIKRFDNGIPTETALYDESGLHFASPGMEEVIKPLLGNAPALTDGEPRYYTEPLTQAGKVYVFGGGHVAQELVPVLSHIGFSVVLYEDRENFARDSLFPDADNIILHDFMRISEKINVTETDYVIVMTRGHQKDYEVLEQIFRTKARYVGCIGSSKKVGATKQMLIKAGIPESSLARLHSPIGLKIKAETPAEIAISIAAEMILTRAENLDV